MLFSEKYAEYIKKQMDTGMIGLDKKQRFIRYHRDLKETVRGYVKEIYLQLPTNQKSNFYFDVFKNLKEYDTDFLLNNLYYEDDWYTHLYSLKKYGGVTVEDLKDEDVLSRELLECDTNKRGSIVEFSIAELNRITGEDVNAQLDNSNENENPFVKSYANYLITNINGSELLYSMKLFTKICFKYEYLPSQNNIKGIIYLSSFKKKKKKALVKGVWVNLFEFEKIKKEYLKKSHIE